jgi:hypothetical protein
MATAHPSHSWSFLYLAQLPGLGAYRVGCCDDLSRLLGEPNRARKGIVHLEAVPRSEAAGLEAEVTHRLRASFSPQLDPATFCGDQREVVDTVRVAVHDGLLAAQTRQRAGLEPANYMALLERFLRDRSAGLEGRLVPLHELERAFEAWQAGKVKGLGGGRVPLLHDPFLEVCREFGAVANERAEVRFRAPGESSMLDVALRFKWRVKEAS